MSRNIATAGGAGDRLGPLVQRGFHTRDGESRTALELEVEEFGASLRYASVTGTKTGRDQDTDTDRDTAASPGEASVDVPVAVDDRSA